MKIVGTFIDCINEQHLYNVDLELIRLKLINKLPDSEIVRLSSILAIETKYDTYIVKIRNTCEKADGSVDIDKVHSMIKSSDFIEISKADYNNIDKHENIISRTRNLITPGANIIFKLDIDVDTII